MVQADVERAEAVDGVGDDAVLPEEDRPGARRGQVVHFHVAEGLRVVSGEAVEPDEQAELRVSEALPRL